MKQDVQTIEILGTGLAGIQGEASAGLVTDYFHAALVDRSLGG